MKLEDLGKPAECSRCHKTFPSDRVIFEGADLEPICRYCLQKVDAPRADILARIQSLRKPGGNS
jgi:hypothetical protein